MKLNLQTFGIDISSYSGKIEWTKLIDNINPRFVFVRAYHMGPTRDKSYKDELFANDYWPELAKLGLPRGAYLYCDPKADAKDSIAKFFSVYAPQKGDLLPVLDIEDNYDNSCGVPLAKRIAQIETMIQLVENKIGGQKPIIYTKQRVWNELGNPKQFVNCPLWVLNYFTLPTPQNMPTTWPTFAFWQYARDIKCEGIFEGDYDLNLFNGVEGDLKNFVIR